jgi:hypothetical protein
VYCLVAVGWHLQDTVHVHATFRNLQQQQRRLLLASTYICTGSDSLSASAGPWWLADKYTTASCCYSNKSARLLLLLLPVQQLWIQWLRQPLRQWTLRARLGPQAGHGLRRLASPFTVLAPCCGCGETPLPLRVASKQLKSWVSQFALMWGSLVKQGKARQGGDRIGVCVVVRRQHWPSQILG